MKHIFSLLVASLVSTVALAADYPRVIFSDDFATDGFGKVRKPIGHGKRRNWNTPKPCCPVPGSGNNALPVRTETRGAHLVAVMEGFRER